VYRSIVDDAVTDTAAQLSYYVLFSLFPFLFFLVTLTAYLPLQGTANAMLSQLGRLMPGDAYALVQEHLSSLLTQTRPKLLTLGFAVTLWSASRGVDAFRKALNLAYDVKESRPFWKTQGVALLMTAAGAILMPLSFAMVLIGGRAGYWVAERADVGEMYLLVWSWLRWPTTASVVMLAAALAYWLLPDVKQEFKYITPGSVLGTLAWLATTWGFTQYVEHFGKYNVTYGSIGGVIVLLLWLYLSGLVFIVGGEINAVIEHASEGGKDKGARAAGEAAPPEEDRPKFSPPGVAKRRDAALRQRLRWIRAWKRRNRPPSDPPDPH
jgi:membrane protein